MANLQDLFNELQADDRVLTPDTFEEFQSKMESPEYASRVNDVLNRYGYDANAYEGLKKKEESMVESAPLSQQDSEQPSETTEPTQEVGTEPVEEAMNLNEVDVNQFSQAFKAPEIEMPIAAVGVNPISDNQNQNVVKPVQNQVAETQQDLDHPVSKIANLAKNLKGKLTNHPFMSMSKDIALGTAAFSMEEDEVENTLDAQEDIDKDKEPKDKKLKRRDAKNIADETGMDYSNYNYFYNALGKTKIYGIKTNAEKGTVELIYKNQDDPGSRAIKTEVPIGGATYKQWIEPQLGGGGTSFYDYNGDESGWDDLKKATLTVSGYKPKVQGQEYEDNLDINYSSHLEKTNRPLTYITNPVAIPSEKEEKDKTFIEKVVDYTKGKISDVEKGVSRANEYLQEKAKKRQEDIETYRIAEQTVQNTSYVTKADDSFRNSPYNSSWTNDILEKYQIPISELLLDGNKEQILNKIEFDYLKDFNPKITAGDVNATGIPGQELSPFAEETRDEYAKRLKEAKRAEAERLYNMARRDAQFHLAELAIMNQIEKGNPKFRYEDVERLRKIKNQGLESANVSDYATGYEDQAGIHGLTDLAEENYSADINIANAKFARNMIDYANSEYTGYYKSLAGISAMNLEEKGISNDSRALNGRKKELASKVEEAKKRNNIPDDAVVKNSVKGAKAVVTEMTAIDKQIEEKTNQYNAMLVEENGQKVFKSEDDFAAGEKIRGEVEALLQKREEVKLKMNEFSPVLDVVQKYSDETRDAYNEMMTIDSELSRFGSDKDVKLLQDLSPTLELIEGYDLNREMTIDPKTGRPYAWVTAGRKTRGELGEFTTLNTYEDNLEASEKAEAENDTWVEAFGKGVWGTVKNMGGSTLLTGEYLSSFVVPGESFLNDDPTTWTAVDNRKAMYENKMERIGRETVNPAYETWGAKWIVGSLGSIAPYIYASWAGGGSGGFFQIAKSQGLKAAASKTLTSQTTAFFTTLAVGNYTKEFEDAGYDPATALLGGSMLGAATSWMESLFPELPEFERLAMQSAVKKIVTEGIKNGLSPQQITRQLLNGFWKTTGKSIVNVATGFAQEGGEEGGTFIVEQGVMSAAGVRENEFIDPMTGKFGSTTKEFLTTVGLGGITGIFTSGGSVLKTLIQEKSTNLVGKQAQLSIAENYDDAVSLMSSDNDKFKESDAFKQVKNIKDRYDEMASNPKFQEFDDVAKGEILNANIELTKMMDSDKTLQSKGITDIKLQEDIKNTQDALNKLFEVSQERVDQRNELNSQLKELGVTAFQVNAEGKVSGMQFDEMTTTEEQNENTPKAVELIEKTNTKTQEDAVQKPSTTEVLPRQQGETTETGGKREGVGPSVKGQETAQEGGKEEIIATPQEKKETEAMQTDIDQVQQSTGTVINLNEDGTLTINAPQKGGQSKKDAAIENAKQELANLGYNVESRVTQPAQQQTEVSEEEVSPLKDVESTAKALEESDLEALFEKTKNKKYFRGQQTEDLPEKDIFISPNELVGKMYTKGKGVLKKLALKASNLFDIDTKVTEDLNNKLIESYKTLGVPVPSDILNGSFIGKSYDQYLKENPEFRRALESMGFDGLLNNFTRLNLPSPKQEVIVFDKANVSEINSNLISEAYHAAKADGSNPELVEAVESLLNESKPQFQKNKETVEDSTEAIVDEMNKMGGVNIEVDVNKGLRDKGKLNIKSFLNRVGIMLKPKEVKLSDFAGKPIMVTISDELTTGEIINPITGEKIDNLKGGLGFNYSEGNEGHAWAYTNEKVAMDVLNVAKQMYAANPSLYPDGIVPVAVVKMGKSAMISNEAVVRQVIQNLKTSKIPSKNKKEAFKLLSQDIKAQIQVVKERIDKAQSQDKQANQADANILKGYNDILDLISKSKTFDEVVNKITDLNIGVRPLLISRITSGSADLIPKDNALSADKPVAKALMNGLPKAEYKRIHLGHLVSNITEPALKEVPDKHIMAFVGIDARAETPIKSDTHPNYPYVLKGKGLGILSETVHIANAIPAAYGNIVGKLIAAEQKGGRVSQNEAVSRALPAALNNAIFRNKPISEIDENVSRLIGFLQLSFPNTQFFTDKESWKDIMNSDGVKKYLKKGDVVYGLTMDGKIYLNPNFSNFNTPIHETGHLWVDMIEESSPELFQKGLELVEGSKELASAIKVYGDTVQARKEALAMLIGNRGETLTNAAQKSKFKEWLLALWKYVQSNFPSLRNMKPSEVENLTLEQFINGALRDILGAKELETEKAAKKRAGKETKPQFQIDIEAQESPLYQRRTKEDVPFVADSEIKNLVQDGKGLERERDILNKGYKLKKGEVVTSRINLNFLRFTGIPALSIHKGKLGEVLTYAGSITLKDVTFPVQQGAREAIAKEAAEKNTQGGSKKTSMAGGQGSYIEVEPNFDGVELSFNPAVGHLFVDSEGRAVMSAEEVTFVGFKAYARGKISYFEDFEDPRNPKYTAPSQTKFAKTKDELVRMADDVETGNTTVEEVGVPEVAPEVVAEAITAFSDAIENGSTIEEATEEVAIVLENSAEEGPRKVTPPTEKTEPVSANKKEEKPKTEKKEKTEGPTLSDPETIVAFTIAGNAKSIMDVEGVSQADAVNKAVLEMSNGDQESANRYLAQPGVKETIEKRIKQMKAKTARELEAESNKVTISERKLLLDRVKAEIKAALEGRKEGKKEGVEQAQEKAQKTIDSLNKKLEEGKITKKELQDRIKELGYNIRFEAGLARLAGEKTGKSLGKKFGEFVGYFKGLKAGRAEQRGLGALVSEYIKDVVDNEFGKKGAISPATLKAISRRAATISNQKQLDAFVSYLDKIIANRRLAEGINEIQRQQKKLLNKIGYQYTTQMKQFAKFDLYTADGDLAFDMNTLEQYLQALQDLNLKVPNIGKMVQLFDGMNAINQSNLPADLDAVEEFKKYQDASTKLFQNTVINNFDDYKKFKREVNKYIRAVNNLLDLGAITELQHQSFLNSVVDGDAKYNTYAGQFQDEIDALKKTIIDGIVDKSTNSLWDSIKDWLTNSPNNFTRNQKKLIEQLQRAKADNLMTLSLDDLDLLNQVVTQIAENGFVDEKNLRSILDRAEIRGEKIGEQLISQSNKMSSKYKGVNAFMKMSLDLLNKSVVFWESRLGMKENGAFRKNVIDPITNAINGWTEDTQRILKGYRDSVVKLKLKGSYKVKTTKLEKGQVVPTGKTRKISKEAYRRVKIGVIGHILDNAWNAKQKKKVVNDWLGDQLRDNSARNAMADESIDELDIVQDVYNDLLQQFSDANGNLDHMAILEAFEDPQSQSSVMSADELEYYDAARTALQESGEYINSANSIRNKQHELNPYYMPRQSVGEGMSSITSNDVSYNQELGTALRSSASYARTLQVPKEAIRFNVDRLVSVNVTEGLRDYYLTDAKRYVNEVFSNARENATNEEMDVLRNLQRLNNTRIPFALNKVKPVMIASPLMNLFYTNALIGVHRTPVEFLNNVISYSLGNRSSKSLTLRLSSKEKEQTNNLLSEFRSSVQFDRTMFEDSEKETRFISKKWYQSSKGLNGMISTQKATQLLIPALNNITAFMRKGEWKTQFDRAFENITGEKFNYEKHFVKEKAKYFDDMEQAASDADFNVRRIIKGGNKSEQRQFVQWVPFVKKGRVEADGFAASFLGMFSGFIGHDVDNMTIGLRKAVKSGEVKDGVTQFLGAAMRLSLYPTLMLVVKSLSKMYFGDDDEKENGKETLDRLKTPEGWADLGIYTARQLTATTVMGKYAFGGKVIGNLLLHLSYTMTEDRRQRRFIEDTMRELYFTDPIDLKYFNKDDWQLQMTANLEPISKMLADDIKNLVDDINNKGREKVTIYDIYEWTQQTDEGKQWLYMANSILTLGQLASVTYFGTAIPLVDDTIKLIEDELSKKEMNKDTTYETPGGQKIDMRDLVLDSDGRVEINIPGITPRDRDRMSDLATEKFNNILKSMGVAGSPGKIYAKLKFMTDLAKYEAAKELGYSDKKWSDSEGELVSAKPEWESYAAYEAEPEDLKEKLHTDIAKGKQLSFTQNLKEKRRIEDFMFKAMDNNPQLKQAYKDAPDGGKLGVREYYKDLYLYEKYRVTDRPKERDYFKYDTQGKIKQTESIPQEEN
jgi:hypothetical protein